jgi:hypothetical protein
MSERDIGVMGKMPARTRRNRETWPGTARALRTERGGNFPPMSELPMSERSHFWLRIAGLALILVAEFGPRLWGPPAATTRVASMTSAR